MTEAEYFFYEWLIVGKRMTEEALKCLTEQEFDALKDEYVKFKMLLK